MHEYILILGLSHCLVFVIAAIFFGHDSKKSHRETLNENDDLRKEIERLEVKIKDVTDILLCVSKNKINIK